jgi:hypothetical protein
MLERLRRWGLLDRTLPGDHIHDDYVQLGILPMLWEWASGVWTYALCDWDATVRCIRYDHPDLDGFLTRLGWRQQR